jgi:HEAT repeat protein
VTGIWTIGREREKAHAIKYIRNPKDHALIFDVIDAVEDIKAGGSDFQRFIDASRDAFALGGSGVWEQTAGWVRQVGQHHPLVHAIWDDLAASPSADVRWRVACVLYQDIPERLSHQLFDRLRSDKSKRVRAFAIDRYENTAGPDGHIAPSRRAEAFDLAQALAQMDGSRQPG